MKRWLIMVFVLSLTACSYAPIYNGKDSYSGSQFMLMESPRHTLDFLWRV